MSISNDSICFVAYWGSSPREKFGAILAFLNKSSQLNMHCLFFWLQNDLSQIHLANVFVTNRFAVKNDRKSEQSAFLSKYCGHSAVTYYLSLVIRRFLTDIYSFSSSNSGLMFLKNPPCFWGESEIIWTCIHYENHIFSLGSLYK